MLQALKYHTKVKRGGIIELKNVPLKVGTTLEIIVLESNGDTLTDLVTASQTSLEFWNNEIDDRVWNDA